MKTEDVLNQLNRMFRIHPEFKNHIIDKLKRPTAARIEAHSGCNARCIHCPRSEMTRYQGPMPRDIFIKAIEGLVELSENTGHPSCISHHLNGEPLLLDIDELIWRVNYTMDRLPNVEENSFFTNASLLTEEKSRKLCESKLNRLCFSFDGGTKEDYENVRIGLRFEEVFENIKTFCRINKEEFNNKLKTQCIFLPQKLNEKSVDAYYELMRPLGITDVGGTGISNIGGKIDTDSMRSFLQFIGGIREAPCWRTFTDINVMADGRVCACCQDVLGSIILGDIKTQTMKEVWTGEIWNKWRVEFMQYKGGGRLSPEFDICNKCDFMMCMEPPYWWPKNELGEQWRSK